MRVGSVSHLRRLASLTAQHEFSAYNVPENGAAPPGGPRRCAPVLSAGSGESSTLAARGKIKIAIADTRLTYD